VAVAVHATDTAAAAPGLSRELGVERGLRVRGGEAFERRPDGGPGQAGQ
jgi:hypothetical protein